MKNIDFKDTDRKFKEKIYGIEFEINVNELEKIDTNKVSEETNTNDILEKILGEGACEKLNNKREENGYEKLNTNIGLAIIMAIVKDYVEFTINPIDEIANHYNRVEKRITNINRKQRQSYNRRNNYNRRRY